GINMDEKITGVLPKATTIDGKLRALKDFKEKNKKIKEEIQRDFKRESLARANYFKGLIPTFKKSSVKPTHRLNNITGEWEKIE
ncbi:MAG TPA: hypothetical protein PLF61_05850, partial [Candidatus Goldiibacteriota bacterium]|nr:hypothetical protein [Candidatus Goldiibacteriota bacterium]